MLQELADQSKNQGVTMNKMNTKLNIENDTPLHIYIYLKSRRLKAMSTWIRYTEPLTQIKTRRLKEEEEEESDGQHSPSTAIYSWLILEHP